MASHYDMEKLNDADRVLAAGTGSIQQRLRDSLLPLTTLRSAEGMSNKDRGRDLYALLDEIESRGPRI